LKTVRTMFERVAPGGDVDVTVQHEILALPLRSHRCARLSMTEGKAAPQGVPEGKPDRAQGLGHRRRKWQLRPRLCHHEPLCGDVRTMF